MLFLVGIFFFKYYSSEMMKLTEHFPNGPRNMSSMNSYLNHSKKKNQMGRARKQHFARSETGLL